MTYNKLVCAGWILAAIQLHGGQFMNLDFESPRLPLPDLVARSVDAVPDWNVDAGVLGPDRVFVNGPPLAGAAISFFGPLSPVPNPQQNLYSVSLYSGNAGNTFTGVSISQAALVPESSKSLCLEARIFGGYSVTLDGAPIYMYLVSGGTEYDTYYGDISNFAGMTADLKIETAAGTTLFDQPYMYIDKISFSTLVVPEPSTYTLFALGLFGLCWRTRNIRV